MITAARLRQLLTYDESAGLFRWNVSRRGHVKAGDEAGCVSRGYRLIGLEGHLYLAHGGRVSYAASLVLVAFMVALAPALLAIRAACVRVNASLLHGPGSITVIEDKNHHLRQTPGHAHFGRRYHARRTPARSLK